MKIIYTAFILTAVALLSTACQTNSTTTNNAANQTANKANTNAPQNTNQANKPETNVVANEAKTETNSNSTVSSSATTPTATYKAAYAARKNKDIKALKQLISKEMFEFFEILGEGKPNPLDEGLKEMMEQPQGSSDETRNEKISGNTATLQYRNAKNEWETGDFVKEDGMWKMTIPEMDDEKKSK